MIDGASSRCHTQYDTPRCMTKGIFYRARGWREDSSADVNGTGETNDSLTELQEMSRYWKSERSIVW